MGQKSFGREDAQQQVAGNVLALGAGRLKYFFTDNVCERHDESQRGAGSPLVRVFHDTSDR